MPSSANIDLMTDPDFNKKVLYALTTLAIENGLSATATAAVKAQAKIVARNPKAYSPAIATLLAAGSNLTATSPDADFITAVRQVWPLFQD